MDTKLTLKLDKDVITRAKAYALRHKISLSHLVENYLSSITAQTDQPEDTGISSFVDSISSTNTISPNIDAKKDYRDHLNKKHT